MKFVVLLILALTHNVHGDIILEDLTYDFDNETTHSWAGLGKFQLLLANHSYIEANTYCSPEHSGTHMDAPRHFVPGTHGINEVSLERLITKNVFVVDVSKEAAEDPDLSISVNQIKAAENTNGNGPLTNGAMVLLYTGYSHYWSNATMFFGGDPDNSSTYHFPGLSEEAAKWLVEKKIGSIGTDARSFDTAQDTTFPAHHILFKENIPGFENINLTNIVSLRRKKDLTIIALPMKIKDGSGAPARVVAMYSDSVEDSSSAGSNIVSSVYAIFIVALVKYFA